LRQIKLQKKQSKHIEKVFTLKKHEHSNVDPVDPYLLKPVVQDDSIVAEDATMSEHTQ
jgi:hypothetical protein